MEFIFTLCVLKRTSFVFKMSDMVFYNVNNLHVKIGLANEWQLTSAFKTLVSTLDKMYPGQGYDKCSVMHSVVYVGDVSKERAYVWVSDPRVHCILTGLNPDGTSRCTVHKEKVTVLDNRINAASFYGLSEDEMINKIVDFTENAAEVVERMEPILTLKPFEYTPEQAAIAHARLVEAEETEASKQGREPNPIGPVTHGHFRVERSSANMNVVQSKNEKCQSNVLFCPRVPEWVSEFELREIFSRFAKATDKTCFEISMGEVNSSTRTRTVMVNYKNSPAYVGIFALQLTRRLTFTNHKTKEKQDVIFNHYIKKDSNPVDDERNSRRSPRDARPRSNFGSGAFQSTGNWRAKSGAGAPDDGFTPVANRRR